MLTLQGHRAPYRLESPIPAGASAPLVSPEQMLPLMLALNLTDRELDVTCLFLECKTRKEIAIRLGIKGPTVNEYVRRLYAKLGVRSPIGIVLRLIKKAGLLNQPLNYPPLNK